MNVVGCEETDEDDPSLFDINASRDMPALADDMNLRAGAILKPHKAFRAQEPIAERRACGLELPAVKALIRAKRDAAQIGGKMIRWRECTRCDAFAQ